MPKELDEYVAENRQNLRQVDRRFIQVSDSRDRNLSFTGSTIEVGVEIEVYKRSPGTMLIFGSSQAAHGFGRGTFGDDRGAWSLITDAEASAEFTKDGRKAVADALDGQTGALSFGSIGYGTTDADTGDTSLESKSGDGLAHGTKDAVNILRCHTLFSHTSIAGDPTEFGIFDENDRLLARVTISSSAINDDDEIKADIILTFTGNGVGDSVVTNDGEEAIAESIRTTQATVGIKTIRLGTGSTDFTESSSALNNQTISKDALRNKNVDLILARTYVLVADQTNDLFEMGVFDNTGRMIWATTFKKFPDRDEPFFAEADIRVI